MHLKLQRKGHTLKPGTDSGDSVVVRLLAVCVAALLALGAGNAFAQAAYVHAMTGSATATSGTTQRALKVGDTVESGTVVSTGEKSSAVIKFEDGQVMALAERTSFRIVDYRYNKQRVSQSSAVFSLLQGGLRFISGVIGSTNRNNFRMTAGTATIGIRGTDGTVTVDAVTQAVTAAVNAGALEMATPQGAQNIGLGNFASAPPGSPPSIPAPTAQATAAVQQTLNTLAATQNLPVNTPVVVAASAAAAAAQAQATQLAAQAAAQPNNPVAQAAALQAAQLAEQALATAVQAAQDAYQAAVQAGAVAPAPAAPPPPPPPPSGTTDTTTDTSTTSSSTSTPTGAGGAGGGGTTASPN
jgi:hypothetical protein